MTAIISEDQVAHALTGMPYPARRWQAIAWADFNCASDRVREALQRVYRSWSIAISLACWMRSSGPSRSPTAAPYVSRARPPAGDSVTERLGGECRQGRGIGVDAGPGVTHHSGPLRCRAALLVQGRSRERLPKVGRHAAECVPHHLWADAADRGSELRGGTSRRHPCLLSSNICSSS